MDKRKELILNKIEIVGFLVYFLVIFCERLLALIFSVRNGGEYALIAHSVFNYTTYTVTTLSLFVGTGLAVKPFYGMCRALFSRREMYSFQDEAQSLAVAVVVILVGGMMHTGFTLGGLQFVAYGFLIASFIVRAVEKCLAGEDKFTTIVSVLYLTLFSMSIPVCYNSALEVPFRELFYTAEFVAVFMLVPSFGYLLFRYMRDGVTTFSPFFPVLMLLLSGATIGFGWKESVNLFLLIFVSLTLLAYLTVGLIAKRRLDAGRPKEE